jgi:ABC-2 type transport system permease protein
MAVYDHAYRRYAGPLTPWRRRPWVLVRYSLREVFASRLFLAFLVFCAVVPLGSAIVVYLHHNLSALAAINLPLDRIVPIDASFFRIVVKTQCWLGFFLALGIGPGLLSADVRNNALPLYLARPLTRAEYLWGKAGPLLLLLSAVTWVPGLLLFLLQASLGGWRWTGPNLYLAGAILASSCVWIAVVTLATLAVSAWVKWKAVARIVLLALVFVLHGFASAVKHGLGAPWGDLASVGQMNAVVRAALFRQVPEDVVPPAAAVVGLAAVCLLCLLALRRLRAYAVVR